MFTCPLGALTGPAEPACFLTSGAALSGLPAFRFLELLSGT